MKFSFIFFTVSVLMLCSCSKDQHTQSFTLEEKVGQILMVHFHGEIANDDAKTLIHDTKIGGVIYYNWSNGLHSPSQVKLLSESLQELALNNRIPVPLFIATDQEGGRVTRLKYGFTEFPSNKALAKGEDISLIEKSAYVMGRELLSVGVNMNLAPVVDINSNPLNPVIGDRSFGDNPEIVIACGKRALSGFGKAKIMTVMKHFPGHGDTQVDSHIDLPVINKSLEDLQQLELLPFIELKSYSDAIMTAHLLVPSLDPDNCTTLSEKTLTYLRDTIGFKGLIISDSLVMEGVCKKYQTIDEVAIQALKAGCDILLLGGRQLERNHELELSAKDIQRIHGSIVKAVHDGYISEERVDQALEKILKLKQKYLQK